MTISKGSFLIDVRSLIWKCEKYDRYYLGDLCADISRLRGLMNDPEMYFRARTEIKQKIERGTK